MSENQKQRNQTGRDAGLNFDGKGTQDKSSEISPQKNDNKGCD